MDNLEFLRNRPIAHRGLYNKEEGIPENSLPSFQRAIENNYPIELDVHLLEDGKVVVFHDNNLKRMTGVDKEIKDCTYNEIKDLKLDGTRYGIPLFSEVLELVDGRVPILIELKYDRKAGIMEEQLVKLLDGYRGKYAIQSFNPMAVLWFKKNYPNIPRGQLSANFTKDKMLKIKKFIWRNVYFNFLTKPDFISFCIHCFPNKRVEAFRKSGKLVLGWTARTDKDLEIAKKYCDNIIGENFDKLDLDIFYK